MWNGKKKAVTFSFDDGVVQDIRLAKMLNKYGLRATFNINSGKLGVTNSLVRNGHTVCRDRIGEDELLSVYQGHEIAAHTLTHPNLTTVSDDVIIHEVEEDRKRLSELMGYEVVGMAYPGGGVNNNEHVANVVLENTGIKYARTTTSTYSFDMQDNLLRFNPSVYYIEDCLLDVVEKFLASEGEKRQLLYIWGHSYEMDAEYISWERFEDVCKRLSGHAEIFYGTNKEVLLG